MLSADKSNIPEEFCRIITQKPRLREKIKYKKWLAANDGERASKIQEEKMRELRKIKQKLLMETFKVKESALTYKASPRIRDLALPKLCRQNMKEVPKGGSLYVKTSALKYTPTKRILELAKPKHSKILTTPFSFPSNKIQNINYN